MIWSPRKGLLALGLEMRNVGVSRKSLVLFNIPIGSAKVIYFLPHTKRSDVGLISCSDLLRQLSWCWRHLERFADGQTRRTERCRVLGKSFQFVVGGRWDLRYQNIKNSA